MEGTWLNLAGAFVCSVAFVWEVDVFCDWYETKRESHPWGGVLIGGAAVVMLGMAVTNIYLFSRA